jgi:hypothetical protein
MSLLPSYCRSLLIGPTFLGDEAGALGAFRGGDVALGGGGEVVAVTPAQDGSS